jgi:hypothetical protein
MKHLALARVETLEGGSELFVVDQGARSLHARRGPDEVLSLPADRVGAARHRYLGGFVVFLL